MPLPIWMVGIRDPAHAYMLWSSGMPRPRRGLRRRRPHGRVTLGYGPLGSPATEPQPLSDDEVEVLRAKGREFEQQFTERFDDIRRRHGELLRATATELARSGAATLRTTAGDVRARAIPFRGGAVVLEVSYPGGWSQGRSSQSQLAEAAVNDLASALAQSRPPAEPLREEAPGPSPAT